MKKTFVLLVIAAVVFAASSIAMAQYPEYCQGRPSSITVPYSLPDFGGKTHYWVQCWNAPGWFAKSYPTDPDFWPVEANKWDGITYDGHFMYNPYVDSERVYFEMDYPDIKGPERYFQLYQVATDPRLTNLWMSHATDPFKNLWEAVERGAISEDHPDVTLAIINHMVACGVVDPARFTCMTEQDIRQAVLNYTDIALNHHAEQVRNMVSNMGVLTAEKLQEATPGDTLKMFYGWRFGPLNHPTSYIVIENNCESILVSLGEEYRPFSLSWTGVSEISDFITLVH